MKASWVWPGVIIGLLAMSVGFHVALVHFATADTSSVVIEDYYRKALAWDDVMAQQRANDRLGWTLEIGDATRRRQAAGPMPLRVRLFDEAGRPLPDAAVELEAFPLRDGRRRVRTPLVEQAEGEYLVRLPVERRGLWELRFEAVRDDDRFTRVVRRELSP